MFKSEALKNNKELSQDLLATTSRVVALARIAAHDSDQEDFSEAHDISNNNISATENIQSMELELQEASGESDSWSGSKLNLEIEDAGQLEVNSDGLVQIPNRRGVPRPTEDFSSTATDPPSSHSIFGNGWLSRRPRIEGLNSSHAASDEFAIQNTFGLRVVETTLRLGYLALKGENVGLTRLQKPMFRWALSFHNRDELLFNLRWFLGPGRSSLPVIGQASFGFVDSYVSPQNSDSFNFGIGSPNVLNPFVDVSAIEDAHKDPIRAKFLNAFDIESYLRQIGAFYFDQTVIKLDIQAPEDPSTSLGALESTSEPSVAHSQMSLVEERIDVPSQELDLGYSSSGFGTPADVTSVPSSEASIYNVSNPTEIYDEHILPQSSRRQVVTLNVPLLLHNLAEVSMCLGTGPGFLQKDVDKAIVSSVSQTTAL